MVINRTKSELSQVNFLLVLYFFAMIQSYSSLLTKLFGIPALVFINFLFLFVMGLMLQLPILNRFLPKQSMNCLKYVFFLLTLFNISRILFGHSFSLFSFSSLFIAVFFIPFVFLFTKSKLFAVVCLFITLIILLYGAISNIPINISGNMLAYIDTALEMILQGKNPYIQKVIGYDFIYKSITYAPMMLIPYLPFKMLGLDIRYLNVLSAILFIFLWWLPLKREENPSIWQTYLLGFFCILTSPYVISLITTKHIFFVGVLIYLFSRAVIKNSWISKSVFTSLVICARQFLIPIAFPALFDTRKKMIYSFLLVIFIGILICFPFAVQNPLLFINNISGLSTTANYNDSYVDFNSRSSPGGGNSYNLGHMLKMFYPKMSSSYNLTIFFFLFCLIMLLLYFKKITQITAVYFVYLSFLAFSINFSSYFLWGIYGILLAVTAYDKGAYNWG